MKAPSKRGLLLLAGALIFALGQTEGATNISNSPNTKSMSPRIAVDTKGNIHVVWGEQYSSGSGDCFYTVYTAASKQWSTPENISGSGRVWCDSAMTCAIDVDSADRVYAVWVEGGEIKLRIRQGGSWGGISSFRSGGGSADTPRIAASPDGDLYIVWWTMDGAVFSCARVGGNWEGVRMISEQGHRSKFPDIACGPDIVYAVWVERSGDLYQAIGVQRNRGAGSGWSGRQSVSPSSQSQQHAVVEVDGNNIAHIIWTTVLDETGGRIVHYVYGSGGRFSSAAEISSSQVLHYPSLDHKGSNLYAAWQLGSWGGGQGVMYNICRRGIWSGEAYVADSQGVTFCDIATNADETAVYVVWDGNDIFINTAGGVGPGPAPNKPPVANFLFTPTTGEFPLDVTFDASLSYDPDGRIVAYNWDFGDGGEGTGRVTKHMFQSAGRFQVNLTVTDNGGKTANIIKIVEVLKPNEPPAADFRFSPESGIFPLEVTFDASASSDPDGEVVAFEWDFGDGQKGGGKVVKHWFARWGTYIVQLIVMDDRNAAASKVKTINVLRLFQPLNIRWETHMDEGLFLTRYVTDVFWERNPENDKLAQYGRIVKYRVFRKKSDEDNKAYKIVVELGSDQFRYRDPDVGGVNVYSYTVTALDDKGHESPIEGMLPGFASVSGRSPAILKQPLLKITK